MTNSIANFWVPPEISFADLKLIRESNGGISFDWSVIKKICEANEFPIEVLREGPEDNISALFVAWYYAHCKAGGTPDPVAEDLIAEVRAEDQAGQAFSLPPGRA